MQDSFGSREPPETFLARNQIGPMPQSLSQIYVHVVFSTKDRKPWLDDRNVRNELHSYMAKILRDTVDSPALKIESVADHLHALIRLSRQFTIMKIVQESKVETSKWLKRQTAVATEFAWQAGYGAFSVSASMVDQVKSYIQNQEVHHRKVSFKDEFRLLCQRHGLTIDERYVWQ